MRGKLMVFVVAIVALGIGVIFGYQYMQRNSYNGVTSSTVFSPPQAIASFSLVDSKGKPFNNNTLSGQWTFLFFGFTGCTQICPPTLNNLNKMYQILLTDKQRPMPHVVFISVDPENDTLQKLGQYVSAFNPHFQGATGDKKELDTLASSLSILYIKQKKEGSDEMSIDHSGAVVLINPAGKLTAIFSSPHDPQMMAKDFQVITANTP